MRLPVLLGLSALMACSEYGLEDEQTEPVANAGPDQERQPLQDVILDGSGSRDPAGRKITAFRWTLTHRPEGSIAELDRDDVPSPAFWADLAGEYVVELTVQNEQGTWDSTPDEVVITVLPLDGFYVELSWDEANDLDLHLMDASAVLFGAGDCNFCNMAPDWGGPGQADDPSLDADAIYGFGPETITIDEPSESTFYIAVHYYGEESNPYCQGLCAVSEATVNVYLGGVLAETFQQTLSAQGELWQVARIEWPSGQIEALGEVGTTAKTDCAE